MITFENVIGNELIKKQFTYAIENNTVSHAYIIEGEKGFGKKSLARDFAASLLGDRNKVMSFNHPDVIYVTHEKPDSIGVEDIRRQLNDTAGIKPYLSDRKIYIIDEAEKMTQQAQNALLKTLEEPPEYMIIMLLTTGEKAFLNTVYSRCIKMKMKPVTDTQIMEYLEEHYEASEENKQIITAFAAGNPGRAIRIAESGEFKELYTEITDICKRIKSIGAWEINLRIKKIRKINVSMDDCFNILQLWYRDLMMYKVTKDVNAIIFKNERAAIMELAALSSYEGIECIMEAIEKCRERIKANVNPELAVELLLLTMREN